MKKYALRYTWGIENKKGGYTKKDIKNDNHGLADAILCFSILRHEDGTYTQVALGADGETGKKLTQDDIFKVWMLLGVQLHENNELDGFKKTLVDAHTHIVRQIFQHKENCPIGHNEEIH